MWNLKQDIKFQRDSHEQRKFRLIGKSFGMEINGFCFKGRGSHFLLKFDQTASFLIKYLLQVPLLYPLFFCYTAVSRYSLLPCHYQLFFPIFFLLPSLLYIRYSQKRFINALSLSQSIFLHFAYLLNSFVDFKFQISFPLFTCTVHADIQSYCVL
jgi:hypothetical protein